MTDFIPICDAKTDKKGNIKGVIIKCGDLKSGTTKTGADWTKKEFIIEDKSGSVKLIAWNENISQFKLGGLYEITVPQWNEYKGEQQISPSKYGRCTLMNEPPKQETVSNTSSDTTDKLPPITPQLNELSEAETITLMQIRETVKATLKHFEPHTIHEGGEIGMITSKIYDKIQKVNFEKANEKTNS